MRELLVLFCVGSCFLHSSCFLSDSGPPEEERVISVSPYSTMSDEQLEQRAFNLLRKLHLLSEQVWAANSEKRYEVVREKGKDGLQTATEARVVAMNIDDPELREKRVQAVEKILADWQKIVEFAERR